MNKKQSWLTGVFFVASLAGFGSTASATTLYLKGDVVYLERMALPKNAQVEVTLADVSLADNSAPIIAKSKVTPNVGSPIPYELQFDSDAIRLGHSYALHADITIDGNLLFSTIEPKPIFVGKENDTQIMVQRTTERASTSISKELTGEWKIVSVKGKKTQGNSVLDIQDNGRIAGTAGCNRFGGNIKIEEKKISFGQMISTQMACSEALMQQERNILQEFGQAVIFKVVNNELILCDQKGNELIKMARK